VYYRALEIFSAATVDAYSESPPALGRTTPLRPTCPDRSSSRRSSDTRSVSSRQNLSGVDSQSTKEPLIPVSLLVTPQPKTAPAGLVLLASKASFSS